MIGGLFIFFGLVNLSELFMFFISIIGVMLGVLNCGLLLLRVGLLSMGLLVVFNMVLFGLSGMVFLVGIFFLLNMLRRIVNLLNMLWVILEVF